MSMFLMFIIISQKGKSMKYLIFCIFPIGCSDALDDVRTNGTPSNHKIVLDLG